MNSRRTRNRVVATLAVAAAIATAAAAPPARAGECPPGKTGVNV